VASKPLLADPRYGDFVDAFQNDPLGFVTGVCAMRVSDDQRELLLELIDPRAKVTVVSGTSTGKTAVFGRIALWHLLCFPVGWQEGKEEIGSNTYIGATNVEQVGSGVWKEMTDARAQIAAGPCGWIADYFVIDAETAYVKGYKAQWYIKKFAMPKGQSISVAGKHRYWQMIIVDEAAGPDDAHFDVINGTQTGGGNRTLLASQGVRNAGYFYKTHHELAKSNGGPWTNLIFSSINSPFASREWLKELEIEAGGVNSEEYRLRALGQFVEKENEYLLTRQALEVAFSKSPVIKNGDAWGWVMLVDVGAGEYRDDSVCVLAKVYGDGDHGDNARRVEYHSIPICTNSKNLRDFRGRIAEEYANLSNCTIYIDAGGNGLELVKWLEEDGLNVVRVNWGAPCERKEYKNRYFNLRACAMVRFRDAVRQSRVSLPKGLDRNMREKIYAQGSRLPYSYTDTGTARYKMQGKDEMRKAGIKSPDIIDAMTFIFLEKAYYNVSDAAYSLNNIGADTKKIVTEKMRSVFGVIPD
jgi:hypothetical protein